MIFGLGTDILDVARMERMVAAGERELSAVFTPRERAYCDSKARRAEHYAARFAAKEAFLKALGTGWRDGLAFAEIEVLNDDLGKPALVLHGKAQALYRKLRIKKSSLSMSHLPGMAIAVVILEK
jgi:holo-[acyl-carrier protein] synthase